MNALHRKAEDSPVHDTFTSVFRSLGDSYTVTRCVPKVVLREVACEPDCAAEPGCAAEPACGCDE